MSRRFRSGPEASAELEEAAGWYEDRRAGLGVEFLEAIDAALDRIARWPRLGRPVPGVTPELRVRMVPVPRFPYRVVYLETPDAISILAFAHERREPSYWYDRIGDSHGTTPTRTTRMGAMRTVLMGERPPEIEKLIERRRALGQDLFDEVWEGDYHLAPAAHGRHGRVDFELAAILRPRARRAGLHGSGPANLGTPDDYRVPDLAFLRRPRHPDVPPDRRAGHRDRVAGR